jgi:hypothetical protein
MSQYRVEIDGQVVWSGEGEGSKAIPAEYRERPADTPEGEPHPTPVILFEDDAIIGVQVSRGHERDLEADPELAVDRWAALTSGGN